MTESASDVFAGLIHPNHADLQQFMPEFFAELGVASSLSEEDAGILLSRYIAEAISRGLVSPYTGARYIWALVNEVWPHEQHRLLSFVGNASEYEDWPEYRPGSAEIRLKVEHDIVEDARNFLHETDDGLPLF